MAFDYRSYDMRDLFTMAEVARLWCEIESLNDSNKHCANSMIHAMREAIALGTLVPEQSVVATVMLRPDSNEIVFGRLQLRAWAEMRKQRPPFLFPELRAGTVAQEEKQAEINDQKLDKACVQAVARTLRELDPDIKSAHLAKHHAIRIYANGQQWKPSTIRTWIREIDERPMDKRAGRAPKKTAGENIQPDYETA